MTWTRIRTNASAWWVTVDGVIYKDPARRDVTMTKLQAGQARGRLAKRLPMADVQLWSGHVFRQDAV